MSDHLIKTKWFSPSARRYRKKDGRFALPRTQEEYEAWARQCKAAESGSAEYKRLNCRREEHRMVVGGRQELRRPYRNDERVELDWSDDEIEEVLEDTGGDLSDAAEELDVERADLAGWLIQNQLLIESEKTQTRLDDQLPVWSRRTQAVTQPVSLESQIKAAIDQYIANSTQGRFGGFYVPDVTAPLERAGMPSRAARILVKRARGRYYNPVETEYRPPFHLLSSLEQKLKQRIFLRGETLESRDRGELVRVTIYGGGRRKITLIGSQLSQIIKEEKANRVRACERAARKLKRKLDEPEDEIYQRCLSEYQLTNAQAVSLLFSTLEEGTWRQKGREKQIQFRFKLGEDPVSKPITVKFPDREHSKLKPKRDYFTSWEYKTLNVPLAVLPSLLASLSKRKKRKGRSHQAQVKSNPMRSNPSGQKRFIACVQQAQEEARQLLLAGRTEQAEQALIPSGNFGSNRVWFWSDTKEQLSETTASRALSWLRVSVTGKIAKPQLELDYPQPLSVRSNPMPSDDFFYRRQYSQSPYGARQSIPAARRNRKRKRSKGRANPQAAQAMELLHNGTASSLKEAWSMVKRSFGGKAKANTRKPPRRRARSNPAIRYSVKGQPYVLKPNGGARFISKAQAARLNRGEAPDFLFKEHKGQFSTGLRRTKGIQPYARRNYGPPDFLFREHKGQFSTGLRRTKGVQPYARRNKKKRRR